MIGAVVLLGFDHRIEAAFIDSMPDWLRRLRDAHLSLRRVLRGLKAAPALLGPQSCVLVRFHAQESPLLVLQFALARPVRLRRPARARRGFAGRAYDASVRSARGAGLEGLLHRLRHFPLHLQGRQGSGRRRHFRGIRPRLRQRLRARRPSSTPATIPGPFPAADSGFDFAATSVKMGYEMGRFTPYVTTGVGLAKATNFGARPPNAENSINGLFNGPGAVQAVGTVGVGLRLRRDEQPARRGRRLCRQRRRPFPALAGAFGLARGAGGAIVKHSLRSCPSPIPCTVSTAAPCPRRGVVAVVRSPRWARLAQQDAAPAAAAAPAFGTADVVKRARELASAPFDATVPPLPESVAASTSTPGATSASSPTSRCSAPPGANFRLELFHLGHLYKRPVVDQRAARRHPAPIPYASNLFDYGHNKIAGALPINLGFAGFRLHYPLNAPHVIDEVIAFLGASYYRFLGRGQRYGLSARGLGDRRRRAGQRGISVLPRILDRNAGSARPTASSSTRCSTANRRPAPSASRSYPALETSVDVSVTLFARRAIAALDMAPLSSMFFTGKNDHRLTTISAPNCTIPTGC